MKLGQENYNALMEKLIDQRKNSKDYTSSTKSLLFKTDENKISHLTVETKDQAVQYGISNLAERQLASKLNIPPKYYDYMKKENPELLDYNINTWFNDKPNRYFIRTMYGETRAFLSDRYRIIDNLEIAQKVLKVLNENNDFTAGSLEVTESHLYVKVVSDRFTDEITKGDVVQAGFVVSNSEVGLGCVKIEPLIYRMVCSNGMILPDRQHRKYHAGQRQVYAEDVAIELFRQETLEASDNAYMMQVEDILRAALNDKIFREAVNKMRMAKENTIDVDPVETTKALGKTLQLTEAESMKVGANYLIDNDFTQYGLANAITRTANTTPDYERATELERMGGLVLDMDIKAMLQNVDSRVLKTA